MPTPTSTPTPAPANALHVGDIDGTGVKLQQGAWKAIVTITIHDSDHAPVAGAVVSGTFYQSTSVGPLSCTTGASGSCSIDSGQLPSKQGKASFTIETVTHASSDYDPSNNHDVDGDSDGTTISLSK